MDGVVSVLPNTILKLHTTKSWDFMGVTIGGTVRLPTEGDVIVGLLDTGIYHVILFGSSIQLLFPLAVSKFNQNIISTAITNKHHSNLNT